MNISYQIEILKTLTFARVLNALGLKWTFWKMKFLGKMDTRFLPMSLSIEPTTACNLSCPECPSGLKSFTRPTGKIDLSQHALWLDELSKTVFYINYYFQGEPFLHPQFLDLIKEAKQRKITTSTSTNGHFIDAKKATEIVHSGLSQLIISIDGLTQKSYEAYRVNGQLEKVFAASNSIVEAKKATNSKSPHVVWQFLVVSANEEEIESLFERAKEYGIDEVRLKTAQLYDFENGHELMPKQEKYSRYKKTTSGKYVLKNKLKDECWRMWSSSVITWDGKVVPCCFDKDAKHLLGDLNQRKFQEIWQEKAYVDFRQKVFAGRNQIDICQNCTEGTQVFSSPS